jgi:hypothetical protein
MMAESYLLNLVTTPRRISCDFFWILVDVWHNQEFFATGFPQSRPQRIQISAHALGTGGEVVVLRSLATLDPYMPSRS